jgi:hypothetical protein
MLLMRVNLSWSCWLGEVKLLALYHRSRPNQKRGDGFWREFRHFSDLVADKEEFLERHRISTKFDSSRPLKHLWRNLTDERIERQSCGQTAMFLPDEFNLHFTCI